MASKIQVILIGAGEQGSVIKNIFVQQSETFEVLGFLDDSATGSHILGSVADFVRFPAASFFICIGDNQKRLALFKKLKAAGVSFVNALHPTACIESKGFGENIFVGALSYVGVNAKLGDAVYVNNHCVVEHDNIIGEGSHLAPGSVLGGGIELGSCVFIGLGARVNDHLSVGTDSVVASGAVVIESVPPGVLAAGVPASVKRSLAENRSV